MISKASTFQVSLLPQFVHETFFCWAHNLNSVWNTKVVLDKFTLEDWFAISGDIELELIYCMCYLVASIELPYPFILCCRDWKAIVDDWIAATKATMDSDSSEC